MQRRYQNAAASLHTPTATHDSVKRSKSCSTTSTDETKHVFFDSFNRRDEARLVRQLHTTSMSEASRRDTRTTSLCPSHATSTACSGLMVEG
eukprot:CAMPEP_0180364080 /NCGR_PEP_ID=MMETSP0989-20121125/14466_1 /TAXON_ID=697907 /ORGANISM="non described non described, Strain CCMP2293" /LENGTH=91 /DNA_ID=CAMNT_0022356755 /DNA_START=454 /DNA_END=729 /DNA_ORIENTATION=+